MTHKERRIKIKTEARERLKNNTSNPYLAALIVGAVMIGIIMIAIISIVAPLFMAALIQSKAEANPLGALFLMGGNINNMVINIVINYLLAVLTIGFSWYTLRIYRHEENLYRNVFSGFSVRGFWTLCANLLAGIFEGICVFIPTLIVIIIVFIFILFNGINGNMSDSQVFKIVFPAIILIWILCIPAYILAYGFRMINYIMYDNREISADKAVFKSWKIMKGHKWELFKLDLTLIGWQLITMLTFGIAGIYTMPYIHTVYAGFYDEVIKEQTVLAES